MKGERCRKNNEHLLIGLMSGTSLDGVDAALVRLQTNGEGQIVDVEIEEFVCLPYSKELKHRLLTISSIETAKLDDIVTAHFGVSEWYVKAVETLLQKAGIHSGSVDAVCSHGQTIWHTPNPVPFPGPNGTVNVRSSLQIGELSVIAERTGIPVVGNFRARDLAAGGEGAPLVPYADFILFGGSKKGVILQNIGGIGNATVLPPSAGINDIFAFDTGPGNMVIDAIVRRETNGDLSFDKDGRMAASGTVSDPLLQRFLDDPFYSRKPPKSTGREMYNERYVERFVQEGRRFNLTLNDLVATATALTAKSIVDAYHNFVFPTTKIDELIVSGGGTHNPVLMDMINAELPDWIKMTTSATYGIPDDAKEAVSFAILGHETLMERPSNVPAVTGATRPVILGNVCF